MRRWLPAFAYDRPVTVFMGFVALLVVGFIAYTRIPVQMLPSGFQPNFLYLSVPWGNASPTETDERIIRPLETQLATVPGIQSMRSEAGDSSGSFFIRFHSSADMDEAYNAVVDRVERAMPDLPDDVKRYWIYKFNPQDEPIVWAGVALPEEVEDPYHFMTRIVQPRLERVPGVASVEVWGVPQQVVRIDFDRELLFAHGINLSDVQSRLSSDNFQMSGGEFEEGGQVNHLRSLAVIGDLETLKRYPVRDGLVLEDISNVYSGSVGSSTIQRINGEEAAAFAIKKESSANTVETTEAVALALDELRADPRSHGADFFVFFDQGELIGQSISTLANSALTGAVFALILLFVFLREWRMTLLIAASIPFSLLITVAIMYFRDYDLNLISLMGLMLAVGMVVDNAIVVVETIYRHRAEGKGVREAAIAGAAEVNLAIIMSTATTMVVFLPVILMTEDATASFFLGVLGMPVVFALAASLLVALVFAPLATRYIGAAQIKADPRWLTALASRYRSVLDWVLKHRVDSAMALIGAMILTFTVAIPGLQCAPPGAEENLNDFTIRFTVPPQASMSERDAIVRRFEDLLESHREDWGLRVYRVRLGGSGNSGRINVYLESDGPLEKDAVMDACREAFPTDLAGVTASIGWGGDGNASSSKQIRLTVNGENMDTLRNLAEEVARRTRGIDGVLAANLAELNDGQDEIRLVVRRDAISRYGLDATSVGRTVSYAMRGSSLPPLRDGEREIDLASRFSLEDRSDLDVILDFELWSPTQMGFIPIRAVTDVQFGKGPSWISREEGQTSTAVTLDLEEGADQRAIFAEVDAALEDMVLPRGYTWSRGMQFDQQASEDAAMWQAMLMSVAFVFLLMGVLFESFVLPMSILSTIPLAMLGAVWGLYLTGTPMDTMAGVGLVVLVGVVVNNGIVLVDLVTQLRSEGMTRHDALLEAGQRRLRPILMTAMTTIFGLLPMAFGSSSFIGVPYAPLGRTVIAGLSTATVLTLVVVPFFYTVLDDAREFTMRWFALVWSGGRDAAAADAAALDS